MGDSTKWDLAMQSDMMTLHKNITYNLVQILEDKHDLHCKWFYGYKLTLHDGKPKHKAKLVTKDLKQE